MEEKVPYNYRAWQETVEELQKDPSIAQLDQDDESYVPDPVPLNPDGLTRSLWAVLLLAPALFFVGLAQGSSFGAFLSLVSTVAFVSAAVFLVVRSRKPDVFDDSGAAL